MVQQPAHQYHSRYSSLPAAWQSVRSVFDHPTSDRPSGEYPALRTARRTALIFLINLITRRWTLAVAHRGRRSPRASVSRRQWSLCRVSGRAAVQRRWPLSDLATARGRPRGPGSDRSVSGGGRLSRLPRRIPSQTGSRLCRGDEALLSDLPEG